MDNNYSTKSEYVVTRYSLIPNVQISIQQYLDNETKEEVLLKWLKSFETKNCQSNGGKFSFYCTKISENRYVLKFAKKTEKKINQATSDDIILKLVDDYPYSVILIDTETQIMLIQKNTKVCQDVKLLKNTIAKCITSFLKKKGIAMYIELLTKKNDFWKYVNENNKNIQSVEFTLISPNFLKSAKTAKEFVKSLKDEYNNDSVTIRLVNEEGNLAISEKQNFISDAVKYSSSGCGKWKIRSKNLKPLKSEDVTITQNISQNILSLTAENLREIEYVFRKVNAIEQTNLVEGE